MYDPYPAAPRRRSSWPWLALVAVIVVLVAVVVVYILYLDGAFGGGTPGRPAGIFYYGFFPFFLILLLVFFLVRVVFWTSMAGYRRQRYRSGIPGPDPAIVTVRQRYARGEISREQYDQMMTELTRRRHGP